LLEEYEKEHVQTLEKMGTHSFLTDCFENSADFGYLGCIILEVVLFVKRCSLGIDPITQ